MSDRDTTADLLGRLERHYIKPGQGLPGGIFVPEVGQNGSSGAGSRCDAIYVGFTSTSGRLLVGHEIKVSRADWLNELSHPGKSDAWADQCHEWWLVVPDPSIVHDGELPAGWGLMTPSRRTTTRLQVHTKADRKPPGHVPSWDAVRSIMARQDTLREQAILNGIGKARERIYADIEAQQQSLTDLDDSWRARADRAEARLEAIMQALGGWGSISFDDNSRVRSASPAQLADLVTLLRAHADVNQARDMLFGRYADPMSRVDQALDKFRAALGQLADPGADT